MVDEHSVEAIPVLEKGAEKNHDGGVQPGAAQKAFDVTAIVGTHEHGSVFKYAHEHTQTKQCLKPKTKSFINR